MWGTNRVRVCFSWGAICAMFPQLRAWIIASSLHCDPNRIDVSKWHTSFSIFLVFHISLCKYFASLTWRWIICGSGRRTFPILSIQFQACHVGFQSSLDIFSDIFILHFPEISPYLLFPIKFTNFSPSAYIFPLPGFLFQSQSHSCLHQKENCCLKL